MLQQSSNQPNSFKLAIQGHPFSVPQINVIKITQQNLTIGQLVPKTRGKVFFQFQLFSL